MYGRGRGKRRGRMEASPRKRTYGVKVSNIPSGFPTFKLTQVFSKYGKCDVALGDSSLNSQFERKSYYAYVNFCSLEEAKLAVARMNGQHIDGLIISVKLQGSENPASLSTPATYTVKVSNVSKLVTESNLKEIFSINGSVIVTSAKLNQTPGLVNFAYVNYGSFSDAKRAVEELNGSIVKDAKLQVKHHGSTALTTLQSPSPLETVATSPSEPASCTVKVLFTSQVQPSEKELSDFFGQFGELKDTPRIRPGNPNFAYINFASAVTAANAAQYPSLEIRPGVTVTIKRRATTSVPNTPTTPTIATAHGRAALIPLCESKQIPCNSMISKILTSSDLKYVQFRSSIAPVSLTCNKHSTGVVLFGEKTKLPAVEALVLALVNDLQHGYSEKVFDLPCMYIPAFSNQALLSTIAEMHQKSIVEFLVCTGPGCMKDMASFSEMVSTKLAGTATEVSTFGIAFHQKNATNVPTVNSVPAFSWSWKDDDRTYTSYDPVSSAMLSKQYSSSPQGSLLLSIPTRLGSTQYLINFADMRQTNITTSHKRKIKMTAGKSPFDSVIWFWEDDHKKMVPYAASECQEIEKMYLSKKPTDLIINGKIYTFDFTRMKQTNKSTLYERVIKRQAPTSLPAKESYFSLQISGLKDSIEEAETKLKEELDNAIVSQTQPLPEGADSTFQTDIILTLHKHFVSAEIVKGNIQVKGVQGYVEKVMLMVREKSLEFQKEHLARAPSTPHSAPVPSQWEAQTEKLALKEVPSHSTEWKDVEKQFEVTLPSKRITSIKRIQNKWQWDRYSFAKERMSERNGGTVNEKMLFHGTRSTPPEKIYKSEQGFDFRFSSTGMWGTGTYFAVNASYSDRYAYQSLHSGKQMILASVLTGETCRCPSDSSLKKPPINPRKRGTFEDELYDSVSGYTNGSDVFIIYDHEKAYPSYLITYC